VNIARSPRRYDAPTADDRRRRTLAPFDAGIEAGPGSRGRLTSRRPGSRQHRRSAEDTRRSPAEVSRLVRHRVLVAVAGWIGRHPEPQQTSWR
jgi:hypothetical protein